MTTTQPTTPVQGGLTDTPREVFLALIEEYRQAVQANIYADWGFDWDNEMLRAEEQRLLRELHDHCDSLVECYDASVRREQGQ